MLDETLFFAASTPECGRELWIYSSAGLILGPDSVAAVYGQAIDQQFDFDSDQAVVWRLEGTLPKGLSFDAASARLRGTAQAAGDFQVRLDALRDNQVLESKQLTLRIAKAPLTITVNDATRLVGQANPQFTVTYEGFVLGDTASSLKGTLQFSTTANQQSPAGSYQVSASGLSSDTYTITYRSGTLRVRNDPNEPTIYSVYLPLVRAE